jgi:hypothetical protein
VHRRAMPDANAVRRLWRALAEDAVRLARGAEDGGEAWSEPLHFRSALKTAAAFPGPRGDALVAHLEDGFRHTALALLAAGTPERRALVAPVLAAYGAAIEALLQDVIKDQVALSRRIAGDNPEED